jgi:ATP-dependent phosphofructokinase / diphosphate-dependent phosphofructokinase
MKGIFMKNLLYFQSGGPTSVINTSLYGVIKEAKKHPEISGIYGSLYGVEGVLNDNLIDLRAESEETVELLQQTPGAILGTTRYKLSSDLTHPDFQKILATLKKHNIGYLMVNGGNDSMDTCHKLSKLMKQANYDCKVIGIPKTIDNDLANTDHCLGFPSAAKFVLQTLQDVAVDNLVYNKGKVAIVEVMGRNAGWLTATAALLEGEVKADRIYLPEDSFNLDTFIQEVKEVYERKKKGLFVISEGILAQLPVETKEVDGFGHMQMGGVAYQLADIVKQKLGYSTRPIEFSLMQRAASNFISLVDSKEAIKVSSIAVRKAIAGKTDSMVVLIRQPGTEYKVKYKLQKLNKIANVEKKLSPELIADVHGHGTLIKEYIRPLLKGQLKYQYRDGVIQRAILKKVKVK